MKLNKKGKASTFIIILLIIIVIALGTYILYDKGLFNKILNKDKEQTETNNDTLKNDYIYSTKDIKCTNKDKNSCNKELKIKVNNQNYKLKITTIKTEELTANYSKEKIDYTISLNNNSIKTIEGGAYFSENKDLVNPDIDIYIINDTYWALGYKTFNDNAQNNGYDLIFFNEDKEITSLKVFVSEQRIYDIKGNTLNNMDNFEFDGNSFKYWMEDCVNGVFSNVSITFDGEKLNKEVIQTGEEVYGMNTAC